jgi:hypothetical protein
MYNKTIQEIEKIIHLKTLKPFFCLLGVIALLSLLFIFYDNFKIGDDFKKLKISGRVLSIIDMKKYLLYNIDGNWYQIRGQIIDHVKEGDSIIKEQNTFETTIISENEPFTQKVFVFKKVQFDPVDPSLN